MLVTRDERKKNEVNFEADCISDSFMDKDTKSDVHFSKPTVCLLEFGRVSSQ